MGYNTPDKTSTELTVLKLSRATTKLDEMINFYGNIMGGEIMARGTYHDGDQETEYVHMKLNGVKTHVHFINRPAREGSSFSVEDFETYVNGVHDSVITSTNCGFDKFADNHWALDSMERDLSTVAS